MEIRILVPAASSTSALAERLTAAFGSERISLPAGPREVDVRVVGSTDRAVLGVIDTVDRWLDQTAAGSAELWLGEHSYRISRPAPVEARQ